MGCIRWTSKGAWDAAGRAAATLIALAVTLLALTIAADRAAAQEAAGEVNVQLNAGAQLDHSLISDPSAEEQAFMQQKYWRARGFAPFFDQALGWAPPTHFYQDLYALYRNDPRDKKIMQEHPDWVLRDSQGNPLYIPWGCSNGVCPQYAADIGNPEFRAYWIEMARGHFAKGYTGIFVDDVNLEMAVGSGNGQRLAPIDPRTGETMTEESWRRYVAEFTEEIRAAFPDKEIVHNSIWWMDHDDPSVQRQTAAADYVEMERGFNDPNIAGGDGEFGYETYLEHAEWLHDQGAGVIFESYELDAQAAVFELASYFLVSTGNDAITSEFGTEPDDWWAGWETDLGAPKGERREWKGLIRRDFEGGTVIVNQPEAPATSVKLPPRIWTDQDGTRVKRRVSLDERSALVLTKGPKLRRGGNRR